MNERITELANRAIVERANGFREFDANVFAELIVRECMNLVKDCYAEPESGQSLYQTTCASTIIEDYFGVEE